MLKRSPDLFIGPQESIKDALKRLDRTAEKVLLVVDGRQRLLGTLSDGDIRRYILQGKSIRHSIDPVYHRHPTVLEESEYSPEKAREILLKRKIDVLPVLSSDGRVAGYISWKVAFAGEEPPRSEERPLDVPVVIMAGGKGTRLDPFTRIIPKVLIPVGDESILEAIINRFHGHGIDEFFLTLNYKGAMIAAYLDSIDKNYAVKYVFEKEFLGTAGSLRLLERQLPKTFLVSNCDILVKADYRDIVERHREKDALLTVVSSVRHFKIPYGVIKFKRDGQVVNISEKPEYTFTVSTGVYVADRRIMKYIPRNAPMDMTDLIHRLLKEKKMVLTYPVNEGEYLDIGEWDEYKRVVAKLKM